MDISAHDRDDNKIISLKGRLDTVTSTDLGKWLEDNFTPPSSKAVLDFSQVEYISSAGLRVILSIMKQMRKYDFAFSICCPHEHVNEVLEISGFTTLIPVHQTLDKCLEQE